MNLTGDPRTRLTELRARLSNARRFLDVESKKTELQELRARVAEPGLWDDANAAREVTGKLARYERILGQQSDLAQALSDVEVLLELASEEGDTTITTEVLADLGKVSAELEILERESLFFGEYDELTALVSVHAGAGGVDAQDWAEMLLRMYLRHFERSGHTITLEDVTPGDEAGIKSASFTVEGDYPYGHMEGERGVHRLVRISPFDSAARRHTSFAAVDVVPEVADEPDLEIRDEDLRIDTFRAQGAGGQHVNTTDSAVRITHIPTGVVAGSQAERSQIQNRARAMTLLRVKLVERQRLERLEAIDEIRGEQTEVSWGRQIRSYVLQPYQMVKDLRTSAEIGNVTAVLDGDFGAFTDAYLQWRRAGHEGAS
jgi:peptide chain release factor 2